MNNDVLLKFLSNGLIDVGGDDAKLEKLRGTASDLAAVLGKTPSKAASYALVAFDPQAPAADTVVREALEALGNRWATYVNTFSGTPVAVVRAMLLDALAQAATKDDRIGVSFVACARNALPFMEVGSESAIWSSVVGSIESKLDVRAESEWATPESISVPPMAYEAALVKGAEISAGKIKRETLTTKIQAAAGPHTSSGPTGGNPNWPSGNQPWITEFGTRMAAATAEVIESAIAASTINGIDISEPLQQLAAAVTSHVENTLVSVSGATAGLQRRTNLLWWKEALYSPSARVSYRDLAPESAAALMALDLHRQVPTFSPASVTAFLCEAVLSLPLVSQESRYSIRDLMQKARQAPELEPLRSAASLVVSYAKGRGPLISLIAYPQTPASISEGEFRDFIGVPAKTPLHLSAWAIWLFRELQAARAAAEGSEPKRRTGKAQPQ